MSETPRDPREAAELRLALWKAQLDEIEQQWKVLRAQARAELLDAITEHGISVAKASRITGHHRQTIKIWLDIYNAEHKNAAKQK